MKQQTGKVVIVGRTHDAHVPIVAAYLDHAPVVIDAGRVIQGGMSYRFTTGQAWPAVTLDGKSVELTPKGVASVWYRNDDITEMAPIPIEPGYEDYLPTAVMSLRRMSYSLRPMLCPDALWVSDPAAIEAAELKPYQLVDAARAGFNVPRTLYTTSPEEAVAFVRQERTCVLKPLAPRSPVGKGQPARLLHYTPDLRLNGVKIQAHIFQQAIRPCHELRVAVIGDDTFASELYDDTADLALAEEIRDVRHGFETDSLRCAPFDLPEEVADACKRYLRLKGLICGYFDLIVDDNGTCYFLECNPNGQWAFVDDDTTARIAKALACLLQTGTF